MITTLTKRTLIVTGAAVVAFAFVVATTVGIGRRNAMKQRAEAVPAISTSTSVPASTGHLETRVDTLVRSAIRRGVFPGAAVAVGTGEGVAHMEGYGRYTYEGGRAVTPESLFDLASLTKVVATTTAAMKLYEQGRLDLDAPVRQYLPEFARPDRDAITIRQLLTHSAGLVAFRPYHTLGLQTRQDVLRAILAEPLSYAPGTKFVYSDHGMILLALVIERITGDDFAAWTYNNIFQPLGMRQTGFRYKGTDTTVVPTEFDRSFRKRLVQGEVHDETAYLLGGTAGHAGLFSTAEDLARFARMLLNGGTLEGKQFLKPETIRLFTARSNTPAGSTRALGWDTKDTEGYTSAGLHFGPDSFGHTGFTGTSMWLEPDADLFVILLTNRVYPSRERSGIGEVRPAMAEIAYEELVGTGGASPSVH